MKEKEYNRIEAVNYARKWAFKRNPKYYDFDDIGGDCTSFISQCLYAGCKIMNYKKHIGWYYNSVNDRAPAWSSVEFLYRFLTTNKSVGPVAKVSNYNDIQIGDIIQLKFSGMTNFSHSLLVVNKDESEIYVATHTDDSYRRSLSTYQFENIRFLHISKVLIW